MIFYLFPSVLISYLITIGQKSKNESQWAKTKVLAGLHSFLEALGEKPFSYLFHLLEASTFLGHLQNQQFTQVFLTKHHCDSDPPFPLTLLFPSFTYKCLCNFFGSPR